MHYAFWHIAVILCDYDVKFVNVSHFNHTVNDKKFLLFLNFINIRSLLNSPSEEFIFISQVSMMEWNKWKFKGMQINSVSNVFSSITVLIA